MTAAARGNPLGSATWTWTSNGSCRTAPPKLFSARMPDADSCVSSLNRNAAGTRAYKLYIPSGYKAGIMPPDFAKTVQSFAHGAAAVDVVFAADNATLYSASADKTAKAWKIASDNPTKSLGHPNLVDAVAFTRVDRVH